jgi:putative addiction module component (TIGR02574 family)
VDELDRVVAGVDRSRLASFSSDAILPYMTAMADKVLHDALRLSEQERAGLAVRLIESLDGGPESEAAEVEAAWAAEIERRCAALDAGATGTTSWDELRRQIKAEILHK